MICKACKHKVANENGFCQRCERIRQEIRRQKQKETENAGRKCSGCHYYKKIDGKLNEFRCTWNNMVYKRDSICFGFKTPTPPPNITKNR